jgi:hypothetical protein
MRRPHLPSLLTGHRGLGPTLHGLFTRVIGFIMACCTIFLALKMAGLHTMPIRRPILSEHPTGTRRSGTPGINSTLNMCKLFPRDIPIGTITMWVSVMTRIFITGTIRAKAAAGRKVTMAATMDPPLRDTDPPRLKHCPLKGTGPVLIRWARLHRQVPLKGTDQPPGRGHIPRHEEPVPLR